MHRQDSHSKTEMTDDETEAPSIMSDSMSEAQQVKVSFAGFGIHLKFICFSTSKKPRAAARRKKKKFGNDSVG